MRYASIDIETGGLEAGVHDLLEVGIVVEDMEKLVPLDQLPTCRLLVNPLDEFGYYRMQPFAAGMNANLLKTIKDFPRSVPGGGTLIKPQFVGKFIGEFLFKHNAVKMNEIGQFHGAVAAGKNFAGFDAKFLRACPDFDTYLTFKHRVLDPMNYYVRPDDVEPPDLKKCCERAGIDLTDFTLHTAVDDAKLVVELIRRGMRMNIGDRDETGARAEGRRAFAQGKKSTDNPYVGLEVKGTAWISGFEEARKDYE